MDIAVARPGHRPRRQMNGQGQVVRRDGLQAGRRDFGGVGGEPVLEGFQDRHVVGPEPRVLGQPGKLMVGDIQGEALEFRLACMGAEEGWVGFGNTAPRRIRDRTPSDPTRPSAGIFDHSHGMAA
ncbi:MAG: hypothetical protein AAF366_09995 [Pseudomonadota bacterium]